MTGHTGRNQLKSVRDLLDSLDPCVLNLTIDPRNRTALRQTKFSVYFVEMLFNQKLNPVLSSAFFPGFRQKDDISDQRHVLPLEFQHHHQR